MAPLASDEPQRIGPHRLLARLGEGGMGRVYLARTPGGHLCALKVVKEDLAHDTQFRARFAREIRSAQRVTGPFTPAVVDADPDGDPPWMATEYVPGPTLKEAVNDGGPFPAPSLLVLALGLSRALVTVHAAGLMHRDLKPSNVLLSPRGPQVIDFGIARAVEGTVLTRTGQTFGTPAYTSPEQVVGEDVTPRSDVFSLAGVVVFAAGGDPPFGSGDSVETLRRVMTGHPYLDAVPEGPVRDLLARCFAKDPEWRPDAEEVHRGLSELPLPPAEHGWLPSPAARQIDVRENETRRAEEAERTTVPMAGRGPRPDAGGGSSVGAPDGESPAGTPDSGSSAGTPDSGSSAGTPDSGSSADAPGDSSESNDRPWWRRRAAAVSAAAAALVIGVGGTLALTSWPLGGPGDAPGADAADGAPGAPSAAPSADDAPEVDLEGWIYDVDFSADGETLYVFGMSLSAWDWRTGEPVDVFEPAPGGAQIGADDHVAATYDDVIRVWDGGSDDEVNTFGEDNGGRGFYDMPALTSDGSRVAVLAAESGDPREERVIQVWDVESGTADVEFPVDGVLTDLHYTPDDSLLVGVVMEHGYEEYVGVAVWDPATGERLRLFEGGDHYAVALSPDSRTMALQSGARRVDVVDLATGEVVVPLAEPSADQESISGIGFSADGSRVYAGDYGWADDRGSVWDARSGELLRDADVTVYSPMGAHPGDEYLATVADGGGRVLVLDSDYTVVNELT
ncbi:WD40 repeat domain-containing serine/threonine protein kinase [Nocardiopsis deserti]|uniref:WD40 repeat domain-containing serine/threonine protein kinase n=1 Tax=Nocardiopsis deserti TaxID=2605988 RepID=UPI00123ABA1A